MVNARLGAPPGCRPVEDDDGRSGSRGAEVAGVLSPFAEAGRHHVGDDTADVALLRRVVVRPGVIACDRHRPGFVFRLQPHQEARCVVDVGVRIQHLAQAGEMLGMVVVIDLHAAQVDELAAAFCGRLELGDRFGGRIGKDGAALDVEGVGLQAALATGLG